MPVNLSVKNVPDELASLLRERARRHQRSMQGELLVILEQALAPQPVTIEELRREVQARALATPSESAAMVRADRDGR
jgi:plasmid stability protein